MTSSMSNTQQLIARYWNSQTVGVCVLDAQLRYVSINEKLASINGIPVTDHEGRTLRDIVGELSDQIEPSIRRLLAGGHQVLPVEISGHRPNRHDAGRWLDHFYPITDETGRVMRVCILVLEITEKQDQREAFEELQHRLTDESARLQMLLDVSALLSSNWDLSQVFPKISTRIRRLLHHEYAAIALHDPGTGALMRQAIDFH